MSLGHALAVDDLLREVNTRMAAAQQGQQQAAGQGQGRAGAPPGAAAVASGGVSRTMLLNALRQLDDVVVLDETTNTIRPLGAPPAATGALRPAAEVPAV